MKYTTRLFRWLEKNATPPEYKIDYRPMHEACPCLHTTPCDPRCTCINSVSSVGCRRCCSYGSKEQQVVRAKWLATKIDA